MSLCPLCTFMRARDEKGNGKSDSRARGSSGMWEDDNEPIIEIRLWLGDYIFSESFRSSSILPLSLCVLVTLRYLSLTVCIHVVVLSLVTFLVLLVSVGWQCVFSFIHSPVYLPACLPLTCQLKCQDCSCHQVAIMSFCLKIDWIRMRYELHWESEEQLVM